VKSANNGEIIKTSTLIIRNKASSNEPASAAERCKMFPLQIRPEYQAVAIVE
jgi:hypothetical protein